MEVRLSPPSPNAKLSSLLLNGQVSVHSQFTLLAAGTVPTALPEGSGGKKCQTATTAFALRVEMRRVSSHF